MTPVSVTRDDAGRAIDRRIVEQAARWVAIMQSGVATEAERAACLNWRQADGEHERAWRRMSAFGEELRMGARGVTPKVARQVLLTPAISRRTVLKAATGAVVLVSGLRAANDRLPSLGWGADYSTGTGQHRNIAWADGTEFMLGTSSAMDADWDRGSRSVVLHSGDLLVSTMNVTDAPLLEVAAGGGFIRASAARFTVRYDSGDSPEVRVAVERGHAEIFHAGADRGYRLQAGEQTRYTRTSVAPPVPVAEYALSWARGLLIAERMPLAQFTSELDRYRKGTLRCDSAVAHLLVSGVFPLNAPDTVLAALQEVLPVKVNSFTRYWTTLVSA